MDELSATPSPDMRGEPFEGRWEDLIARLEMDTEEVVDLIVQRLFDTVPGYELVDRAALAASVRRNIDLSIRTILTGREPSPAEVPEAGALAIERLGQGVPLDSVLSGFRICMIMILRHLIELAPEYDIPAEEVLEWSTLLWSLGDVFSTRAAGVYRDREIARAVADSARRSAWIGRVVAEGVETSELLWGAAMYDVPTEVPVRALTASAKSGSGNGVEERLRAWASRGGARLLTTVRSSVIVGIVIGEIDPAAEHPGMAVGLGGPELLADLPRSFASASLALRAADSLGLRQVVEPETLSWRLAIHTSPETTDLLRRRYLDPLGEAGGFADDLVESVQAYLEHRMNIPAASKSIPVHVNTLRYRLRRFEELTGADLGEVNTLVEVSWVLAACGRGATVL